MAHIVCRIVTIILFFSSFIVWGSFASCATFVTSEGLEPDKIASIWLIKRFVDKEAQFRFIGNDESIDGKDIPFDMPDAKLRRFHTLSTFETILAHYAIKDDRLIAIGRLIHDMEINTWMIDRSAESVALENELKNIINSDLARDLVIDNSMQVMDNFLNSRP